LVLLSSFPFVRHLSDALPGGQLGAAAQRAFWLPWQIYTNVVSGRGIWDSSGFVAAADAGLPGLVGNPGVALLVAPIHALGSPILAHNLALLLLQSSNVVAAWFVGAGLRPRPRAWLAAGAVAGASLWTWQLGGGAWSAAWVAPGLGAIAAAQRGFSLAALGFAAAGVAFAPFPTAAALLGGALVGARPHRSGGLLLVGAGIVVGWLAPSALRGGVPGLPLGAISWPASADAPGLPLLFLIGVHAASRVRGARPLAFVALLLVVVALGSTWTDASGAPIVVDGFGLPQLVGRRGASHTHELLSAALVLALLLGLARAGRARFGQKTELLLVALALLEPRVQGWRGQAVALWQGVTWPAPSVLVDLAAAPYTTPLLQLPLLGVREGLVGFVPLHQQAVSGGPGQEIGGPAREGLLALARTRPAYQAITLLEGGGEPWDVLRLARDAGYAHVVVVGDEPSLRVAMHRAAGPPVFEDDLLALWSTASAAAVETPDRADVQVPQATGRPGDGPGYGRPPPIRPGRGPAGPGTGYAAEPQGAGMGADPRRPGGADNAGPNAPSSRGAP
jgi:hypothetical protein